jgi:hypothetical protein
MQMAFSLRMRIGTFNIVGISLVAGLIAPLSILFLGGPKQAAYFKAHWFTFSCKRIGMLMMVSLVLTMVLILINLLYQGIRYRKINVALLLNILLKSLIASFIVAMAGDIFLICD